jgi:ribosome recycling factor
MHVPKPAVHVPKNVKSIWTLNLVKNAQKHAERVKMNVKSVRQNAKQL